MENINTQTLVHIGSEVIIVAGITFWLNKKISHVEHQLAEKDEQIKKIMEIINTQQQMINFHEQILRSVYGGGDKRFIPNIPQAQPKVDNPKPKVTADNIKEEDLDNMISEELKDLKDDAKNSIEIDIPLKKKKHLKKKTIKQNV